MDSDRHGTDEPRSTLDRLLDVGVFAPLGLALEARTVVPELAATGRRQIEFSRSLGRAAIRTVLKSLAQPKSSSKPPIGRARSAPAGRTDDQVDERADDGAVDGYDDLTARDVINHCGTAGPAELTWIADRERQNKNRITVLRAVDKARAKQRG